MRVLDNYLMSDVKGRKGKNGINERAMSEYCVQEVINR